MLIFNPFFLKTVNNFNASPPFGLYNIFNHLIYHSIDHDKQGLATYKSLEDYRLFDDSCVESLLRPRSHQSLINMFKICFDKQIS